MKKIIALFAIVSMGFIACNSATDKAADATEDATDMMEEAVESNDEASDANAAATTEVVEEVEETTGH